MWVEKVDFRLPAETFYTLEPIPTNCDMEMSPNFVVILNRLSGGHLTQKGRGQIARHRKRKSNFGRFSALYTFSNHNMHIWCNNPRRTLDMDQHIPSTIWSNLMIRGSIRVAIGLPRWVFFQIFDPTNTLVLYIWVVVFGSQAGDILKTAFHTII